MMEAQIIQKNIFKLISQTFDTLETTVNLDINIALILLFQPFLHLIFLFVIPNIIEQLQQNSAFIATIPIQINRQLHHGFSCIYHAKQLELMSFKHPTPLCHFSELMIIDTKRFTIFQQLDERFYTAGFAWFDLVFKASKQSQKIITYKNSSCHKHAQENACFSYLINNKTSLKDSILFQWKNITSKRLKLNLFIWTLASCLAFKPLRLRLLMETWFKKCWSKQTQKTHWHVYKDTDILLNKYMYQKLISSS